MCDRLKLYKMETIWPIELRTRECTSYKYSIKRDNEHTFLKDALLSRRVNSITSHWSSPMLQMKNAQVTLHSAHKQQSTRTNSRQAFVLAYYE